MRFEIRFCLALSLGLLNFTCDVEFDSKLLASCAEHEKMRDEGGTKT